MVTTPAAINLAATGQSATINHGRYGTRSRRRFARLRSRMRRPRHYSIMRRRFVGRRRCVGLGFLEALTDACDLTRQDLDLAPLRGDGLVQGLDGIILKHQAYLE